MKKARVWYAIADGGRARFVERDDNGAYRTVVSFDSADLHHKASDLVSDGRVRVMESATPGRSAVEPRQDPKRAAKEDFVKLVADELAAAHERGAYDQLMLVAPPRVLTELKQKLAKPIADLVVKDLQKDLTKVPDHDLTEHLAPR
jgi:protein required for attachment to host cells